MDFRKQIMGDRIDLTQIWETAADVSELEALCWQKTRNHLQGPQISLHHKSPDIFPEPQYLGLKTNGLNEFINTLETLLDDDYSLHSIREHCESGVCVDGEGRAIILGVGLLHKLLVLDLANSNA